MSAEPTQIASGPDVATVDLYCGAGGWHVAARQHGLDVLGIELDAAPVAVARAAGLRVLQADVAALDPLDFAPCQGVIGSPPCPTFSSAGRGAGRELEAVILAAIVDLAAGRDTRAERRREAYEALEPATARFDVLPVPRRRRKREQRAVSPVDRDRIARREAKRETAKRDAALSLLVVEPLRWALALESRWVALEQVPPVLPLWEAMAVVLRERGYSVAVDVLSSETFGVPQTRKRAILIASLDRVVSMPLATHQRYIAPRKRAADGDAATLFEAPEPGRIVHREDRDLLPWMSMVEALSWGMTARECAANAVRFVSNGQANATTRDVDEPAPTILAGGTSPGEQSWVLRSGQSVAGEGRAERSVEDPSLTITGRTDLCSWELCAQARNSGPHPSGVEWVGERPSTSVNCDPRIAEPGRHDPDESGSQYGAATVRVSIEEAAALQSFPPGYPWEAAGTKTAAFRCVGNAVPPLLAWHVLRAVTGGA